MRHLEKEKFKSIIPDDFSIGMHLVDCRFGEDEIVRRTRGIMENGIYINDSRFGALYTCYIIGDMEKCDFETIERYHYSFVFEMELLKQFLQERNVGLLNTCIVAFPSSFTDSSGLEHYFGSYPDYSDRSKYAGINNKEDRVGRSLPIEQYTQRIGRVPKEFVVGYIDSRCSDMRFVYNKNFIGFMEEDEKEQYLLEMIKDMKGKNIEVYNSLMDTDNVNWFLEELDSYYRNSVEHFRNAKQSSTSSKK